MRKTTAQVKETTSNKHDSYPSKLSLHDILQYFDMSLLQDWKVLLGFLLVIIGVIQLRALIFGIICLSIGIVLIFDLFGSKK